MNTAWILALNCGSSSIKFALFQAGQGRLPRQPAWGGKVQGIGQAQAMLDLSDAPSQPVALDATHPNTTALELILERVHRRIAGQGRLAAVVHRVVHGGQHHFAPTCVSPALIDALRALIPLAPLHQPFPLKAMSLILAQHPKVAQVACFDTAFHQSTAQVEQMFALPWSAWEAGVRRYGFHGLSYDYMTHALPQRHGEAARGRTIVAHLGSGASLCAMRDLKSVATTMGFSALDGLMMGTRCGAIDPGAVIYLMQEQGLGTEAVARMLYHDSGLLGVSGVSPDPRELLPLEATNERVRVALALYVHRIVREIGALTAVLGGLDMLVFTAGIGEHHALLRARICAPLAWLGVELDAAANAAHAGVISSKASRVIVGVEKTNEEWMAATQAAELLGI
ncbi:acetate/propionate family kinase [Comamonas flocculans]|uniref:Acetate kinase n=1 Tax=Comamonas flocculans TaxID=2597701 RepID=A0A5B8RSQ1_9BURK|nr:acetate/propionate family kinase [Comamonas flocculans]QEA12143.1 acetate/propionate family kinase [Comamonas flocculans]